MSYLIERLLDLSCDAPLGDRKILAEAAEEIERLTTDNERLRVVYDAAQALAETWGVKPRANAIELVQFMDNLDDALAAVED